MGHLLSRESDVSKEDKSKRKEEESVLSWLRFNLKCRSTTVKGETLDFFVGSRAVDRLLESPWTNKSVSASRHRPHFPQRSAAVKFLKRKLDEGYFYRGLKVEKKGKGAVEEPEEKSVKQRKGGKKETEKQEEKETKRKGNRNEDKEVDVPKSKRKYTLEIHSEQEFIDDYDVYVWKYNPTTSRTYIIGVVLVVGGLAVSLFPVWPSQGRFIVWYLSMAGLGVLGLFFSTVLLQHILFWCVWLFTHGTHHFWIFPNLTEDVGVLESFKPVYSFEYKGDDDDDNEENEDGDEKAHSQEEDEMDGKDEETEQVDIYGKKLDDHENDRNTSEQSQISSAEDHEYRTEDTTDQ